MLIIIAFYDYMRQMHSLGDRLSPAPSWRILEPEITGFRAMLLPP